MGSALSDDVVWRRVGKGLLGVYAAYLVITNLLLLTHVLPRLINDAQANVTLDYQLAVSPLPLWVWARRFRLVSRDAAIELELEADSAHTWISGLALFRRTFAAHGGGADGVAMRIRQRRSVSALCRDEGAHLPAIDGLAAPAGAWTDPRACAAQAETAIADEPPTPPDELWRVELYGVDGTDIRELWIEQFRFTGVAECALSFALWPTQTLRIPPSTLVVRTASIGRGRATAPDLVGDGRVALELREVSLSSTATLARALSATVSIDAQVMRVGLVDATGVGSDWLRLGKSHGHLALDARIVRGAIGAGSEASLSDATVVMEAFGHTASGRGDATLSVAATDQDHRELIAHLRVGHAELRGADNDLLATGRRLRLDVRAPEPALGMPLNEADLSVAVGALEIAELARWARYLPEDLDLKLQSGSATVSAHVEVRRGRVIHGGEILGETSDIRATYRDLALGARVSLRIPLSKGDLDVPRLELDGTRLQVRDGRVLRRSARTDPTPEPPWTADVTLARGTLRGGGDDEAGPIVDADVRGRFASIRPFLAIYGADGRLPGFVRNYDPGPAEGRAVLHLSADRISTTEAALSAGIFSAEADLYVGDGGVDGGLLLGLGSLRLGVELVDGDSSVHVVGPVERFERGRRARQRVAAP